MRCGGVGSYTYNVVTCAVVAIHPCTYPLTRPRIHAPCVQPPPVCVRACRSEHITYWTAATLCQASQQWGVEAALEMLVTMHGLHGGRAPLLHSALLHTLGEKLGSSDDIHQWLEKAFASGDDGALLQNACVHACVCTTERSMRQRAWAKQLRAYLI